MQVFINIQKDLPFRLRVIKVQKFLIDLKQQIIKKKSKIFDSSLIFSIKPAIPLIVVVNY